MGQHGHAYHQHHDRPVYLTDATASTTNKVVAPDTSTLNDSLLEPLPRKINSSKLYLTFWKPQNFRLNEMFYSECCTSGCSVRNDLIANVSSASASISAPSSGPGVRCKWQMVFMFLQSCLIRYDLGSLLHNTVNSSIRYI